MAGGVCAHHSVIIYVLHFTVCSEKDTFIEGEQEISVLGTVHAQCEPRRHYWTQDCGTVSIHFHNSHVLHTPYLYFLYYTKSSNAYFVYSCMLVIISSKPKLSNNSLIIIVGNYHC